MKIFTFRTVWGQELHAHAKFRRDRLSGCRVIASFRFPIWRAVRHLGFLKYANFYIQHGLRSLSACSCKILSRSVERLRSYCKFSISQMAAVRHLGFFVRMRGTTNEVVLLVFIIVQNLV